MKPKRTLSEVGLILGMTKQEVWQIEQRALRKLKRSLLKRLGQDYLTEFFRDAVGE